MKHSLNFLLVCVFASVLLLPIAYANDGPNADCHVRENGENKKKKSGPCTVTETQGNIWILLANGDSFTLKPRNKDKKEGYKDQKDRVVKVKYEAGVPVYSWEHRHITVNKRD